MNGPLAAIVVLDLPKQVTLHAKANTKRSKATADLQALLRSNCHFLTSKHIGKRFQVLLQFSSLRECILAVGEFARAQFPATNRHGDIHIGISLGEVIDESLTLDLPSHSRARWLTELTSQASVLLSESAALVGQDINLLPYGIEEFGEFFDLQSGQASRVFSLSHPQLPALSKLEDDRSKHNIPWPTEFFIGREVEIETVAGMLEHMRYVRLIGPSGVGKSTLARRIGLEVVDQFRDGVKYVDLGKVSDRAGLLAQIFKSIDFPIEQSAELNLDLVRRHFGGKSHLIILDGCEDLERYVEPVVNALIKTGLVQVLATSIQSSETALGVEYLVEDLPVPALDEITCIKDIEAIDACALFIDGMRKFRQGLPPQDGEARTIFELCRRTGGSPLALNLAARRLKFESLTDVLDNYTEHLIDSEVNASVIRTLDRLSPQCREVIEYASAFANTWTRAQLSKLMDRSTGNLSEHIQTLQILGLVKEETDAQSRGNFNLSSHFRSGIRSILRQESRLDSVRERHLLMILDLCRTAIQEMNGPDQKRHLDFLNSVAEDLESALQFLIESKPSVDDFIEAMRSTWLYWFKRNRLRAVLTLADEALERFDSDDPIGGARLRMLKAIFLTKAGESDLAISLLCEARGTIDPVLEPILFCQVHVNLGIALWADDRPLEALQAYSSALPIAEHHDHKSLMLSAITGLCSTSISNNDVASAAKWQVRFREIARDSPDFLDRWNLNMSEIQLAWARGDYINAGKLILQGLEEARMGGDSALISRTYLWKAQVEASSGQMESAATSLGSCVSIMNSDEHKFNRTNIRRMQEIEKAIATQLGDHTLNQLKFAGGLDAMNWL